MDSIVNSCQIWAFPRSHIPSQRKITMYIYIWWHILFLYIIYRWLHMYTHICVYVCHLCISQGIKTIIFFLMCWNRPCCIVQASLKTHYLTHHGHELSVLQTGLEFILAQHSECHGIINPITMLESAIMTHRKMFLSNYCKFLSRQKNGNEIKICYEDKIANKFMN